MFRPRASIMYSSAASTMRTQPLPKYWAKKGRISSSTAPMTKLTNLFFMEMFSWSSFGSGAIRHALAEQALRAQRQHEDQHDEREDVLVVRAEHAAGDLADVAGAERLDQAQQHAAQHGAGQVADAAEHGRREGLEAGGEAHRE